MNSISNLANAASKAIWGEGGGTAASGEEPVAGEQGAGTTTEPYDKGNEEQIDEQDHQPSSNSDSKKPAMPHTDAEREELMRKGEFPHDPNDHSGEPLKMHDGSENTSSSATKKDRSASVAQEGGDPHGSAKGTGEQLVKSTGTKADGGDFDATKPGAGKEATRLLEQKGVHKDTPADTTNSSVSVNSKDSDKTKTSKMAKIKAKLRTSIGRNKE